MATLRVFAGNMSKLADQIKNYGPKRQRAIALAIDQTVVLATPVGNPELWKSPAPKGYVGGHARSNWQVGIGTTPQGEVDTIDPSGAEAIGRGHDAIASHSSGDIHITNNVVYIIPLNEGHSTQAPAGFVELAIEQGVAAGRAVKLKE